MLKTTSEPQEETLYNAEDIIKDVRGRVGEAGSQARVAEALGVTPAYLSDILRGKRGISDEFAARLGYEGISLWRKAK